ncbi:hypothetical protein HDU76_007394 [Blyttiomyces sp. JEL0837]|nr:hypothetical protein HDU76_007394 [Blyttiomyces sp. JEL0837]
MLETHPQQLQQQLSKSVISWLRLAKLVLIMLVLIATTLGIVAVTQPYYRIVTDSHVIRLGFTHAIYENGTIYGNSVCSLDANHDPCVVSFATVIIGSMTGFGTLVFLMTQILRPSLQQESENVNIILDIFLTLLSAIVSYTSAQTKWMNYVALAYPTTSSLDVGYSLCLAAAITYTVACVIGFSLLWKVSTYSGTATSASEKRAHVVVAGQQAVQSSNLPSAGTYQVAAAQ